MGTIFVLWGGGKLTPIYSEGVAIPAGKQLGVKEDFQKKV